MTIGEVRRFKRNQRIGHVAKRILLGVGAVGFLSVAVTGSNTLQLIDNRGQKQKKWYVWKVLKEMERSGLLEKGVRKGKTGYQLTKKGEELAAGYELHTLDIHKPWRWDHKWRLVLADISEAKRDARNELRSVLVSLGFVVLQKSAWIYPYPCAKEVVLLKKKFGLGREVLYLEVDILENDQELRDIFNLN